MSTPLSGLNHRISLKQAVDMTSRYRQARTEFEDELSGKLTLPLSETFGRQAIEHLLQQPHCAGIRLYFGLDDTRRLRAVLVGVDAGEQDLLPQTGEDAIIMEEGKVCPPFCTPSPLNP